MSPLLLDTNTEGGKSQELKRAWGVWADEVGQRKGGYDWYATLTFRDRTPAEQKAGWTKVGWSYSRKACDTFLRHLGEEKGLQDTWWLRCREIQQDRGVPHYHALIGGVKDLRRDEAWSWWFERYGFARILPYESQLGASFYLCKYVTKDMGDVEFSQNLRQDLTR
jgi:hypothetical protein